MTMKAKTLMTMAVAGTFGLSAAAFAENAHAGFTPFSVSESGEVIQALKDHDMSAKSTSSPETVALMSESEPSAALSMSDSLALADDGVYSDFYVVSWTPVTIESWDVYVINTGDMDELAAADSMDIGMPTHELALLSTDDPSTFELALVPIEDVSESTGE